MSRIPRSKGPAGQDYQSNPPTCRGSRDAQLDLLMNLGPDGITTSSRVRSCGPKNGFRRNPFCRTLSCRNIMTCVPVTWSCDGYVGSLAAAANCAPADFPELLLVPGVGARTVRALALVAEVVHGAPCRFSDPRRFSFAHGGKDRHPFPVPLRVYDETIRVSEISRTQREAWARGRARRT